MPDTLPPTVHERLVRCAERVFVDGLVAGATVELHIGANVLTVTSGGGAHTFAVPPLAAGAVVRARQDVGSGFSPFSPSVVVADVLVPPEATPSLPEVIDACSQCLFVTHATPGARIELRIGGALVGQGVANRHGEACVAVELRESAVLTVRQVVCGAAGPDLARLVTPRGPALPGPVIGEPIFGCQSRVPVAGARRGARLAFQTGTGEDLGSICSCWSTVNVLVRPLAVGETVRTRCLYNANCDEVGPWSDFRVVVPPDERIKPVVLEPLVHGDRHLRVSNQIAGSSLLVRIRAAGELVAEEFGPRPSSEELEIGLGAPLIGGSVVTVVQTLCGVSVESDEVIVQPLPPVIHPPTVVPPMYACGVAVQVSNLHPGAIARVLMDGDEIGQQWAGLDCSVTVPVDGLVAGRTITAIQSIGGVVSPESAPVMVRRSGFLQPPRILGPLARGDQAVWVSGVTPGSRVAIISDGEVIGEIDAGEPVVRVPIASLSGPAPGSAAARVRLCDRTVTGPPLQAVRSPCEQGLMEDVAESTLDLGDYWVPNVPDGGGYNFRLRGQLYSPTGPTQGRLPLVIIAHGFHWGVNNYTGEIVESFKGYDYLARHLVRWGCIVFSPDLQPVNELNKLGSSDTEQFARAEILLHAIEVLGEVDQIGELIDPDRVGLVGHSMAGEAVVLAHFLNLSETRGFGIRGLVSIAPTRWHPDVVMPGGRYIQLFGSLDQLTGFIPSEDGPGPTGGMRIYDRAERDKSLFWIHGLRHNPFNTLWVTVGGDAYEDHLADLALPPSEHERVAKCIINAFFQDVLHDNIAYHGYMEGTVFPESLRHLAIHTSHSSEPRDVLDNFGDEDDQAGVPVEAPLDRTINTRNQIVVATGAGLGDWEDLQHSSVPNSPHSTAGLRISWTAPTSQYESATGGISPGYVGVLSLRVAQFYEDGALNPDALPADMFVALSDGNEEALIRLGSVVPIPFPDAAPNVLSMMRTVRLPMDAFRAANPALNPVDIRSVRLLFAARPTGHILVDDIEFGA